MPITRPMFYLLKHPDTGVSFKFLGVHHELKVSEIPSWCISDLTQSDVLFHEGKDGIVFPDPFRTGRALKSSYKGECYDWLACLTSSEVEVAKEVVRLFYKHVRGQEIGIPELNNIRAWAMEEVTLHASYFATGEEIDYILHRVFQEAGKPIIDLDTSLMAKEIEKIDRDEKHRVLRTLLNDGFLKDLLQEAEVAFNCAQNNIPLPVGEDESDVADANDVSMNNFHSLVEYDLSFSREDDEIIHGRNNIWLSYIRAFLKEFSKRELCCAVVCGAGHLPDLFNKLVAQGFTVLEINADGTTSEFKHKVANYQIEKLVYRQLRAQITGTDACFNWMQMLNHCNSKYHTIPNADREGPNISGTLSLTA